MYRCVHHLCLLVYRLPHGFVPHISSHGNSKEDKPFFSTWKSTISRIKEAKGPKAVVEILSKDVGGMLGATASGQLPKNEKQVQTELQDGTHCDAACLL